MLKPIKLKNITINNPVIIAPMAGITDIPFCKLYKENGAELIVMEMIASNAQTHFADKIGKDDIGKIKITRMFDKIENNIKPISVQIFGSNPEIMAKSAIINAERGADIIDINMGCPVNKIVKSKGGADLLQEPERAKDIIKAVVKAVGDKIPVSIKIRTGWNQTLMTGVEIAKIAEGEGVSFISVHGRTRAQMYTGKVSLPEIKKIKEAVKIPVIGNGDIITEEDAKVMIDETGVDGVMIGRGVLGNPIFISQIIHYLKTGVKKDALNKEEIGKLALQHFKYLCDYYNDKNAVFIFRKFAAWYSKSIYGAIEFRKKVNTISTKEDMIKEIELFFS